MAKDDLTNIKSITRDDTLAALRVPPQLMGNCAKQCGVALVILSLRLSVLSQ